jgi:DNA repair protein RadD
MRTLRDDQSSTMQNVADAVRGGERRVAIQAPTGWGKTVFAAALVERVQAKGKRLIFTVPAISLVDQTVSMFYDQGITDVGVIQAHHHMTDWAQPIQICSIQTLQRKEVLPDADIVLVDENHRLFDWFRHWFTHPKFLNVPFIGLSATPWSKGIGTYWKKLIIAATTQDLIAKGLLSDFKVFAPSHPDLSGVRVSGGDYVEADLSQRMQEGGLTADVVQTWVKHANGRPTLCYAVDRLHAAKLQAQFAASGVPCAYQDGNTKADARTLIKRDFHSGSVKVVVSVGTLTTGIDWDVRCISLVRPTKSQMLFTQIIGRGLRTAPGKDHCLILDHSDNHLRLGFVTDIDASHTELPTGKLAAKNTTDNIRLPKECPQCGFLKAPGTKQCPVCAFVVEVHSKIEPTPGELAELKRKAIETAIEPKQFLAELRCYAHEHGYKDAWAAYKFKEKYGHMPTFANHRDAPALIVSPHVSNWIRSRQIAWIKSKGRMFGNGGRQGAYNE